MLDVKYFNHQMAGASNCTGQAGSLVTLLRSVLVTGFDPKTITITQANGTATATCNSHGRKTNEVILITGANESGYNGEHLVLSVATNTFTFTVNPQTPSPATGTITAKVAPAGWSELFAPGQQGNAENVGVFQPALQHPPNVLQVLDNSPGASNGKWARVRAYESMTDALTGTGPCPNFTVPNTINKSSTADSTARRWDLISDDGFFYLHISWHANYVGEYELSFFGNPGSTKQGDAYCTMLSGCYLEGDGFGYGNQYTLDSSLTNPPANSGRYMMRHWNQVGSFISVGLLGMTGISNYSGYSGLNINGNPPDNGMYWSDIMVVHGGAIRTKALPGIKQYLHDRMYNHRDVIDDPPGLPGRKLIALRGNYGSTSFNGMFLYDLTGPWERG